MPREPWTMLVKLMAEAVVPPASRNLESRIFVESGRRLASTIAKTAKAAQKSQGARWPKRRSAAPCCHSRSYLSRDEGLGLHMAGSEFPGKGAKHDHEGSLTQKTCPFHVMQRAGTAARTKALLPSAIPSVFCMSSLSHNAASSREESMSTPSLCSAEAFSHPTLLR